jgi:cyclophilin family peptidyl-prolyl cis-trans isomerase
MRNSILILAVLMIFLTGVAVSCGQSGEAQKDKSSKQESTADKALETTQNAAEGSGENATGDTSADQSQTAPAGEGVPSSDGTVKTVQNEDGSVTILDESGNVVASTSPAGTSTTQSGDGSTSTGQPGTTTTPPASPEQTQDKPVKTRGDVNIQNKVAIVKTNFGDFYIFFWDKVAPTHVRNFLYLSMKGFYKNVKFHRIVAGFMAQTGQPRPDWEEFVPPMQLEVDSTLKVRHKRGAVAAARTTDVNSATSQWYVVFNEAGSASRLNGQYTVFGQVFKGFETIDKIEKIRCSVNPNGPPGQPEVSVPQQDIHIIDVIVEDAAKYKADIDAWKAKNSE